MEETIKKYSRYTILISLILIIISIFLIAKPSESLSAITIIIGAVITISGIVELISYFTSPKELKAFSLKLIIGVVLLALGIIVIVNASTINALFTAIIGIWIVIESIIKLQIAFNLRDLANSNWKVLVILSIITILVGVLIILNPFGTIVAVGRISGIMLLISEVINLFESIFMIKL